MTLRGPIGTIKSLFVHWGLLCKSDHEVFSYSLSNRDLIFLLNTERVEACFMDEFKEFQNLGPAQIRVLDLN